MKKACFIPILLLCHLFVCTAQVKTNLKQRSETPVLNSKSDARVALQFINDYVAFCSSKQRIKVSQWVENNKLLTNHFKSTYIKLVNSALKSDPELGLDFDPILDAQDYPEKGFNIINYDSATGYVTLNGKDWPAFVLVTRIVKQGNKWLVDGSGVINIPEEKRAKR